MYSTPFGPTFSWCDTPTGIVKISPDRNVVALPCIVSVISPEVIRPRTSNGCVWKSLKQFAG